jgi:hypothetical protein
MDELEGWGIYYIDLSSPFLPSSFFLFLPSSGILMSAHDVTTQRFSFVLSLLLSSSSL